MVDVIPVNGIEFIYDNKKYVIKGGGCRFALHTSNMWIDIIVEGRYEKLHFDIIRVYDIPSNKLYHSFRYTRKYTALTKAAAEFLAENNYIWDYKLNKPFKTEDVKKDG